MIQSVWYAPFSSREKANEVYSQVFGGGDAADSSGWHTALIMDGHPVAAGRLDYVRAGVGKISRVATLPQMRRSKMADSVIRLLIFRAGLLGLKTVQAQAQGEGALLLLSMGFVPGPDNTFTKEVTDGCCENCQN